MFLCRPFTSNGVKGKNNTPCAPPTLLHPETRSGKPIHESKKPDACVKLFDIYMRPQDEQCPQKCTSQAVHQSHSSKVLDRPLDSSTIGKSVLPKSKMPRFKNFNSRIGVSNLSHSLERHKDLSCFYECPNVTLLSHPLAPALFIPPHRILKKRNKKFIQKHEIKSDNSELLYSKKKCYKDLNDNSLEDDSDRRLGDFSSEGDAPTPSTPFGVLPLSSMDVRSTPVKMDRHSPFVGGGKPMGRISPCHDLGYHTLIPRQTPTPTRELSTPSPWKDVRSSPSPCIDICTLSSCPRSSPRPQLPQVPSTPQPPLTPTSGIESTEHFLTPYKGKRLSRTSPFDRLSDTLFLKVLTYLPSSSLCQVARVCRKWHALAWHPSLWETVTLTGETLNVDRAIKQVLKLISRGNGRCDHINKFILNGCSRLTDRGLFQVGKKCPELRVLEIKGCSNVTNNGVFELVSHCHNLEHLDATGCHNITCIPVSPQGIVEPDPIPSSQLYLQYLDMTDCYGLQDDGVRVIVKNCPQLLYLYLRRCINITDMGVKHIASYCLMLKELSVSDCVQITDFGMYELAKLGPNLRYISVAKCDQISDAGIKQIARHCYRLRYLNVRGCEAVSDDSMEIVARSCPRLRALDVGKCDVTDNGMKLISKNCPNLKKLSVKSCDMITDLGIQYIAYYCRGLQQLNIQDCQMTVEGYRTVKKFCRRCIIEHTNPGFF